MGDEFADYLRRLRRARKLSLRELSSKTGIDYSLLSKIEVGERPAPRAEDIFVLADALKADAEEMLRRAEESRQDQVDRIADSPAARTYFKRRWGERKQ